MYGLISAKHVRYGWVLVIYVPPLALPFFSVALPFFSVALPFFSVALPFFSAEPANSNFRGKRGVLSAKGLHVVVNSCVGIANGLSVKHQRSNGDSKAMCL